MQRRGATYTPHGAGGFEGDERTHAVAEQREGMLAEWLHVFT